MNRVIDAANGLVVEWDTDNLVDDDTIQHKVPEEFVAKTEGVEMTYDSGALVTVEGDDIDLSALVPLDRKARMLVAHTEEGELLPPKVDAPVRKPTNARRRPIHFREVAKVFEEGGYQGVQDKYNVGRRQAARYISRARESGFING